MAYGILINAHLFCSPMFYIVEKYKGQVHNKDQYT
jgi:hypothetical protein